MTHDKEEKDIYDYYNIKPYCRFEGSRKGWTIGEVIAAISILFSVGCVMHALWYGL